MEPANTRRALETGTIPRAVTQLTLKGPGCSSPRAITISLSAGSRSVACGWFSDFGIRGALLHRSADRHCVGERAFSGTLNSGRYGSATAALAKDRTAIHAPGQALPRGHR